MKADAGISQDAAIVLALADTAVPFAGSLEDEAERWVRVMRMHGQVGSALQGLGVGEAPLESPATSASDRDLTGRALGRNAVTAVGAAAGSLARERGGNVVTTVDVLFAVIELYGSAFDRAIYVRGSSRDELIERLRDGASVFVE